MFADQAYSLHAVALMAVTLACVLASAFLLALGSEKLNRQPLFWLTAGLFLSLTIFALLRFLLLIAPTPAIFEIIIKLQAGVGMIGTGSPFAVLLTLINRSPSRGLVFALTTLALLGIPGTSAVLRSSPLSFADFCPAALFFAFCSVYLCFYEELFPELSALLPDALLSEPQDLILVFDKSGRLVKANSNAAKVFATHEGMMRPEFDAILKDNAIVRDNKTIGLITSSQSRYYQHSETSVEAASGAPLATVLVFSDVTDMTVLKSILRRKNEQLKRQAGKLRAYIRTEERLKIEGQREKLAQEIEQTIGQKLKKLTREIGSPEAPENLLSLIEDCREIMVEVRLAVSELIRAGEGEQI